MTSRISLSACTQGSQCSLVFCVVFGSDPEKVLRSLRQMLPWIWQKSSMHVTSDTSVQHAHSIKLRETETNKHKQNNVLYYFGGTIPWEVLAEASGDRKGVGHRDDPLVGEVVSFYNRVWWVPHATEYQKTQLIWYTIELEMSQIDGSECLVSQWRHPPAGVRVNPSQYTT